MPTARKRATRDASGRLLVDFALQGGGSHGAFTWGVLDRLLEDPRIRVDGISGTSAGAMNAAVLSDGYARNGTDGAREALENFWSRVAKAATLSPFRRGPMDILAGRWSFDHSPAFLAFDLASRVFSPYDLNPTAFNPLRSVLAECIDFERLVSSPVKVFVTATNVHTGKGRVFRNAELTPDVLLASACLPNMFQAVQVDGQYYWDGGYSGNPTMTPLVRDSDADDVILVAVNPVERPDLPTGARAILDRINEVSFNAGLLKELRMIALLRQMVDVNHSEGGRWAGMRIHLVRNDLGAVLDSSSKMSAEWAFLEMLHAEGRRAADRFLEKDGPSLGKQSSLDLDVLLEGV